MKRHFYLALILFFTFFITVDILYAEVVYRVDAASSYIWRGFDLNPHKKPVIQPSIDFAFGQSGLSLNLWASLSFVQKDLNELDATLSYTTEISKDLALTAGLIHYAWYLADNFRFKDDTSHEIFLTIESPTVLLQPTLSFFYDFTVGDGIYLQLEIGHSFSIIDTISANLSASLGYNGGQWLAEESDPGFSDLDIGLTLPFQSGPFRIAAFAHYTFVLLEAIGEENHFWFGLSLSYSGKGNRE